jgi:hypothetical protein
MSSEEGGTRIQRRAPPQQPPPQQNDPRFAQREQVYQPEQMYQEQMNVPQNMPVIQQPLPRGILRKGKFSNSNGFIDYNSVTFKYAIIVTCIFVLLNSKIIWKQIIQFPFMGGMEPSILALLINSLLAGIIFYVVSSVISK